MWPFSKKNKDQITMYALPGTGNYPTDVVGESFYQNNLDKICGGKTDDGHSKEVIAMLFCDNKNKHDSNAVRVDIDDLTVGHLSRSKAKAHRKNLRDQDFAEMPVRCAALIVGGWSRNRGKDQGDYGVKLDLWDE